MAAVPYRPSFEDMTDSKKTLFGLPFVAMIGLALLAMPRVVLHDLGVIQERTFVNMLFVVVPVVIWIAVVVRARVPNPFLTLLTVGAIYGVLLAIGHQLLWEAAWNDGTPALGGNLSDLSPGAQEAIVRTFAAFSSLFTGVIVGAVSGLLAWGATRLTGGGRPTGNPAS